jgi:hypothetical protein
MNISTPLLYIRVPFMAAILSFVLVACGGGGSGTDNAANSTPLTTQGSTPETPVVPVSQGTVALCLTVKPTDRFSQIRFQVLKAILIGDGEQQTVYEVADGEEPIEIDLLDLTNFSQPLVFGQVNSGVYKKLRLLIDNLELVPVDGSPSIFPRLPAGGKIDMLDPSGIEVLPGLTLLAEIDLDANKSIKITIAGKSMKVNFRPVVRARFLTSGDGLPDKLARLEGNVDEIFVDPVGNFLLCSANRPDRCITVATGDDTSIFDDQGLQTDFGALVTGQPVVVIGQYRRSPGMRDANKKDGDSDSDNDDGGGFGVVLDAIIVELGDAEQIKGTVASKRADGQFLMLTSDGARIVVETQKGTKIFNVEGETDAEALVVGADIEVEGVRPNKSGGEDPDLIRAALIFVEPVDADQLSGVIADDPVAETLSFMLTPADGGNNVCVNVDKDAGILLVDADMAEVKPGTFENLAMGQNVDMFGLAPDAINGCFQASEIIVDVDSGGT